MLKETDGTKQMIVRVREVLAREYTKGGGSQITNCIAHSGMSISERPSTCHLCATDVKNVLRRALDANEFLNSVVDDARAAVESQEP